MHAFPAHSMIAWMVYLDDNSESRGMGQETVPDMLSSLSAFLLM